MKKDLTEHLTLSLPRMYAYVLGKERVKTAMWKYFYSKGTRKWTDVLDQLVYNYNNTKHGTILMKPKDVKKE